MLNPRDPNNEIHLVLTPFEAATLLRFLNAYRPYQQTLAEIADALEDAGVTSDNTFELLTCYLEPTHA